VDNVQAHPAQNDIHAAALTAKQEFRRDEDAVYRTRRSFAEAHRFA
jgi:hypothetical protein